MKNLRPRYHITGKANWINDPNGLVKYKGQYHVFFQHHPYSINWGTMHWGHVVSDDLLNWKHLEHALVPGHKDDLDHCFSGSAIVHNDRLYLIYTGLILNDCKENELQQQCLAYSDDGVHFTKHGLIIGKDNVPLDFCPNDFRDPSCYKIDDTFYLIAAAKRKEGTGNILKYRSKDLINWEYLGPIMVNDSEGVMVECPDYIPDLNLLLHLEQHQKIDGYMHHNIFSTFYDIGEFDENHRFIPKASGTVDYGFDFFAPQVIKGENILIGWMSMWQRTCPSEKYGFAGQLTIPRKIEVKDNRLLQTPIVPMNKITSINVIKHYEEHIKIGFYKLDITNLQSFSLRIREGEKHVTTFDLINNEWVFNRSKSGEVIWGNETDEDSLNGIRRMGYEKKDKHEIYIVLDEFSVELFVDGISMTSLIYPDLEEDLLSLDIEADEVILTKFEE